MFLHKGVVPIVDRKLPRRFFVFRVQCEKPKAAAAGTDQANDTQNPAHDAGNQAALVLLRRLGAAGWGIGSAESSRRFVGRTLFKAIDVDMPIDERADFITAARDVVTRAGFAADYYFIEDRATDVPYYGYYTGEGDEEHGRIYVEDGYAHPQIREISEVSEAVRGLRRGYELNRVCFPAEVKQEIYRLYHGTTTPARPLSVANH